MRCIDSAPRQPEAVAARQGRLVIAAGLALMTACSAPVPPASTAERSAPVPLAKGPASIGMPSPGPVRNWTEVRLQAAHRMVAANAKGTYLGQPPDVLLAIPVLEIELNADGSIRRIDVLRYPGQAPDTTQLAIDAVRGAAPFGDISRLPKPWKFAETFLFDDQRRFKPRILDQ